jgi:hypothetical protein
LERPFSGWNSGQLAEKVNSQPTQRLGVTNLNDRDGIVIVRVQIRQAGLTHRHALQDCHFCDIGGERVSNLSASVLITPHTTATMQNYLSFRRQAVAGPAVRALSFQVIATDQLNQRHAKKIDLLRFESPAFQPHRGSGSEQTKRDPIMCSR